MRQSHNYFIIKVFFLNDNSRSTFLPMAFLKPNLVKYRIILPGVELHLHRIVSTYSVLWFYVSQNIFW